MIRFNKKILKAIAVYLAINILFQVIYPATAYALTSGPAQPEFSSFEPVATTNMVNEFTGDFTYNLPLINIPGPNGGGYATSLSYHSGVSMEEEASWVGYGWTLNPGAINRGVQGIPDDYDGNGDVITYKNKVPKNWTASVGARAGFEVMSTDNDKTLLDGSTSASIRYNNYKGFGTNYGVHLGVFGGIASLDFSVSGQDGHSFSADLNPAGILSKIASGLAKRQSNKLNKLSRHAMMTNTELVDKLKNKANNLNRWATGFSYASHLTNFKNFSLYGFNGVEDEYRVSTVTSYVGSSAYVSINAGFTPSPAHVKPEAGIFGTYTEQLNTAEKTRDAYGYLYTHAAGGTGEVTDYHVEKEATYNTRDKFLSIPYQSPDAFTLTGEGLSGGFRLHSRNPGRFTPSFTESSTQISQVGTEVAIGANLEPFTGFNIGIGSHELEVGDWNSLGNSSLYGFTNTLDDAYYFRFDDDMGGSVLQSENDRPYRAEIINASPGVIGFKDYAVKLDANEIKTQIDRPGRSSYIGYHTNREMTEKFASEGREINYKSFTKDDPSTEDDVWSRVERGDDIIKDRIGEIYTVNENGNRYVYGLPVFSADEKSMSHSVDNYYNAAISNSNIVYKDIDNGSRSEVGEIKTQPYAVSYLLTQITTPDFIDRNQDGPTKDDFGGWTKFNYRPASFTNESNQKDKNERGSWYNWRFPYNGFYYNRGELSDPRDDMGSYRTGKKEIYYMKTIETKTHMAFFITNKTTADDFDIEHQDEIVELTDYLNGSGEARADGLDAASDFTADASNTAKGTHQLERLEKIVLFAKDDEGKLVGKPMKTVFFEYYPENESLVKNLPNSTNGGGKLTLKKVWFEYEGITTSKITPYEFFYEYKQADWVPNGHVKSKYTDIINYGTNLTAQAQNPDYNPSNLDPWGGNFFDGGNRYAKYRPWIYQGEYLDENNYDPAAWQLKRIKLPTGGEILVQYEQHEYNFVQDERALVMIPLINPNNPYDPQYDVINDEAVDGKRRYYLNLDEAGINKNDQAALAEYESILDEYLLKESIYFKFLYRLYENGDPKLNECASDFIDGYAHFTSAGVEGDKVYLEVQEKPLPPSDPEYEHKNYNLPRQVCKSYVKRTKAGLNLDENCGVPRELPEGASVKEVLMFVKNNAQAALKKIEGCCKNLSVDNSYLRVPIMKAKRGGGIRVKRILMYDEGLETGDECLYGTEYIYQNEDGTSSGIATNEPSTIREENALVKFLKKRANQKMISRIISGTDKENFEGPIGESILPNATIGYSRVITKNIHSGKTGTGFKVSEFYTAFDFPVTFDHTEIQEKKDFFFLPALYTNLRVNNKWVSQGYSFITNSMHGKIKRIAMYGGDYESPSCSTIRSFKSYEEVHEYYKPGEGVPVLGEDGIINTDDYPGKEATVTMERKAVSDIEENASVQWDVDVGFFAIPVPMGSISFNLSYKESELYTYTVSKVIRYPAIEKRVTVMQDGIVTVTENKLFDKFTGSPIATVSYDGFHGLKPGTATTEHNGTYTNYTIPAAYIYKEMGQKAKNERYFLSFTSKPTLATVDAPAGKYQFTLTSGNAPSMPVTNGQLVEGDLLEIKSGSSVSLYYITDLVKQGSDDLVKVQKMSLAISLASNSLIDRIEVINSGYNNQLTFPAGTIITYGANSDQIPSPLTISGTQAQQANLSNVFAASANVYSDDWSHVFSNNEYYQETVPNDFESGRRGKWRLSEVYAYKSDIKDAITDPNRIYSDAGVANSFTGFIYKDANGTPSNNDNLWLKSTKVNIYSPHGNPLEETNILDVKSTAKFSHHESVPALVAQNASYNSVIFKSFEDESNSVITFAHSGSRSYELAINGVYTPGSVKMDDQLKTRGIMVRWWIKTPDNYVDILTGMQCYLDNGYGVVSPKAKLKQIARVGEWTLMEAKLTQGIDAYTNDTWVMVKLKNNSHKVWLDDIRVQPWDAEMACYVYDQNNLRLLAAFDDQHFGMFYQYNAEGQLVRKLIETERGVKTITETLYNKKVQN